MKKVILALILSTAPIAANADCTHWSVTGQDGYANGRAQPDLNAKILWTSPNVGNGSAAGSMTWCGRYQVDYRNIEWRWIEFTGKNDGLLYKGWVSAKVMSRYIAPAPVQSFENGGE